MTRGTTSGPPAGLGPHAEAVFDAVLHGRGGALTPAERGEAEAFWAMLGTLERPAHAGTAPMAPAPIAAWRRNVAQLAAAACAIGAVGLTSWAGTGEGAHARQSYASARAERRVVRLDDGSIVTLSPASRVEVDYTAAARHLRLASGEALFEVAHDKARPFIVRVPYGEVRAVGTAFDIALGGTTAGTTAAVTVVDGLVRIDVPQPGGKGARRAAVTRMAAKGQAVRLGPDAAGRPGVLAQASDADIAGVTAWTHGMLVFHGEPLRDVVATVNRYTRSTVRVRAGASGATPVFAVLREGDTSALGDLIEDAGRPAG